MSDLTLADLTINPEATLREALARMTMNRLGLLLVCDRPLHLTGILTDGDARRAMLDEALLDTPLVKLMNPNPIVATDDQQATALIASSGALAVPIVDAGGQISAIAIRVADRVEIKARAAERPSGGVSEPSGYWAIIPARGGSKRIPRKNLALVGGSTLLERAIAAALAATEVSNVLVSTDDSEIATVAKGAGATVPWLRPSELAKDSSPTLHVVEHALTWLKEAGLLTKLVAVLEPTAPLRTGQDIDAGLRLLENSGADSVVSVCAVPHTFRPEELLRVREGRLVPYIGTDLDNRQLRTQQLDRLFVTNGVIYALRSSVVLSSQTLFGSHSVPLEMSWETYLDIDIPQDLKWANHRLAEGSLSVAHTVTEVE